MTPDKEYGKLTLDQFREVVRKLPELRALSSEIPEVLRDKQEKLKEVLGADFNWAAIYEFEFIEQVAILVTSLGWNGLLYAAARSEDPQARVIRWGDDGGEIDQWCESNKDALDMKGLIRLVTVFQRNVLSIMLFHRPLSALVDAVREGGEGADEAFFNAVRVDRSILSCPTFSDRLAHAELIGDEAFFCELGKALKGPSKKHQKNIMDLRYAIAILREMGLDDFSDEQLESLFVDKLKLYSNVASARKNLRKHVYEGDKASTTSK